MNALISQLATEIEDTLENASQANLMADLADELARRSKKNSKTRVISASPLNDQLKARVSAKLQIEQIEFTVDQSIIGGLIIEQQGKRQDMSLRRKVNLVKNIVTK